MTSTNPSKIKLSKRLQTVADRVLPGGCLADVGTDHGYLPIYLVGQKIVERGIALDVNPLPLQRAQEHIRTYGLEDQIKTRLSDGMDSLSPGEADQVLIAGMGGRLMSRILREGDEVIHAKGFRRLILSPQSEIFLVRRTLSAQGFMIQEEHMQKEDGKYYTVLAAEPGENDYVTEEDFFYGKRLMEEGGEVFLEYLGEQARNIRQTLEVLKNQKNPAAVSRAEELKRELARLKGIIRGKHDLSLAQISE